MIVKTILDTQLPSARLAWQWLSESGPDTMNGPTEFMTENAARDTLVLIGGHANMLDMALKFLDGIETIMTPWTDVKTAALHVQTVAPRLVNVTNMTAISFDFLEGARLAIERSSSVAEDVHEIARHYFIECTSMIVLRLVLLLDRDPAMISFQSVYRCLHYPEVVEELNPNGSSPGSAGEAAKV